VFISYLYANSAVVPGGQSSERDVQFKRTPP